MTTYQYATPENRAVIARDGDNVLTFAIHDQYGNETAEWLAIKDDVESGAIVIAPADTSAAQTAAFAAAEDAERMRLVNERARTDPAYAALADFVLRGVT